MDYTNLYDFKTESGMIVPTDENVLSGIQTKFKEIFGSDLDLSAETPVGRLIEGMAVVVKSTLGVTAQSANQFNVQYATGIYLDSIGQIYGIQRTPDTKTKILVNCFFSTDTIETIVIQAGSLIMSSATGDLFRIDEDVASDDPSITIDEESGRTYVQVTATAVNTGPIISPPGTIDIIQSSVQGWTGCSTVSMIYVGTNLETDESFRKRIINSRPVGVGFNESLNSALERIDGVYSSCIIDNNTGFRILKKGISVPAHSVFVCLDFIETNTIKEEIAKAISVAKPVGVGLLDSGVPSAILIKQNVPYGYDGMMSQEISFYKAVRTSIIVHISYFVGNYAGSNIKNDIASVVSEYMDTVGVGGTIYGSMIGNALSNKLNIGINSIMIQKSGEPTARMTLQMGGYETPYTVSDNIFVST